MISEMDGCNEGRGAETRGLISILRLLLPGKPFPVQEFDAHCQANFISDKAWQG
jgi:hypothetical protein